MVDIAHQAAINPASAKHAAASRARVPLTAIEPGQWRALAQRAIEPNGYYLPGWELAVNATARGRTGCLGASRMRWIAADRADAGDLALAGMEDPPARAGERRIPMARYAAR